MKFVGFSQDHNIFVLIAFMIVVFLNVHFATVKFAKLVEHGIKSNPDYSRVLGVCNSIITIKKVLLCTNYQHVNEISVVQRMGHIESFFPICFSVKIIIIWESLDLDFILNQSYILVKDFAGSDRYNLNELPLLVKINDYNFEAHRTLLSPAINNKMFLVISKYGFVIYILFD